MTPCCSNSRGSRQADKELAIYKSTCNMCSRPFEAKSALKKYCSEVCKSRFSQLKRGAPCSICGEQMVMGSASKRDGTQAHNHCRSGVHGRTGYRRGCRCVECRAGMAKHAREYAREYRAEHGVSPSAKWKQGRKGPDYDRSCDLCGEEMARKPAGEKGYHRECRNKVPDWLARGKPGPRQRKALRTLKNAAAGKTGGGRVFYQGPCSWCGAQFLGLSSFYCSKGCKDRARVSRRKPLAFNPSPTDRIAVYERDDWTCQLCLRPVDAEAKHPDPWAPSLDHIIPQSVMIVPDHSVSNLRLAHFLCNAFRRDEVDMTVEQIRGLTSSRWEVSNGAAV